MFGDNDINNANLTTCLLSCYLSRAGEIFGRYAKDGQSITSVGVESLTSNVGPILIIRSSKQDTIDIILVATKMNHW